MADTAVDAGDPPETDGEREQAPAAGGESDAPTPSDAFGALGNEVRTRTLAALLEDGTPTTKRFSELFEASGAETSAGFAYHLRKLTGHYLTEVDDGDGNGGYTLTYAGTQVARDISSGEYTESFDREPVAIDDPCPFCEATSLVATARDNTVAVTCEGCGQTLLRLPFPPGGFRTHDDEELPAAVDRLHRHRVQLMVAGSCPECGGATDVTTEQMERSEDADEEDIRLRLTCRGCAYTLRCPVTLGVLDQPAVVAFYHDHGLDVRERPIWNVGTEWRERVLSVEPWCVRVSAVLDGEGVELFVARDGRVVESGRFEVGEAS